MFFVVLAKEVLAVVVAVGGPNDGVDMLTVGTCWKEMPEPHGPLVAELDEDYGAVYPIIEDRIVSASADPGEVGLVEMGRDLGHLHFGVSFGQIPDIKLDQVEELPLLLGGERRNLRSCVLQDDVVLEGLAQGIVAIL